MWHPCHCCGLSCCVDGPLASQIKSNPSQTRASPCHGRLLSSPLQAAITITNISQSRLRPRGHTKLHHQRPQWHIHHTDGSIFLPQASQVLAWTSVALPSCHQTQRPLIDHSMPSALTTSHGNKRHEGASRGPVDSQGTHWIWPTMKECRVKEGGHHLDGWTDVCSRISVGNPREHDANPIHTTTNNNNSNRASHQSSRRSS